LIVSLTDFLAAHKVDNEGEIKTRGPWAWRSADKGRQGKKPEFEMKRNKASSTDIFRIRWYDPTRLSIEALNMLNG
jgi:hypothetical protein